MPLNFVDVSFMDLRSLLITLMQGKIVLLAFMGQLISLYWILNGL